MIKHKFEAEYETTIEMREDGILITQDIDSDGIWLTYSQLERLIAIYETIEGASDEPK